MIKVDEQCVAPSWLAESVDRYSCHVVQYRLIIDEKRIERIFQHALAKGHLLPITDEAHAAPNVAPINEMDSEELMSVLMEALWHWPNVAGFGDKYPDLMHPNLPNARRRPPRDDFIEQVEILKNEKVQPRIVQGGVLDLRELPIDATSEPIDGRALREWKGRQGFKRFREAVERKTADAAKPVRPHWCQIGICGERLPLGAEVIPTRNIGRTREEGRISKSEPAMRQQITDRGHHVTRSAI